MPSLAPEETGRPPRSPTESLELLVTPRRRLRRARRWVVRGCAGVLMVLLLAFVVPAAFGLSHCTVSDDAMSGTMGRGSVVFTRPLLTADLEIGDVITYPRPSGSGSTMITRRVVDIQAGEIWTSRDRDGAIDPWTISPGQVTQARAVADLPYAGYVYDAVSRGAEGLRQALSFFG